MKTSDLTGAALDWAVAKCEPDDTLAIYFDGDTGAPLCRDDWPDNQTFNPSTDWSQGGPIIEQFEIDLKVVEEGVWRASNVFDDMEFHHYTGPTPLIAAMRCYVASKLGDEVALPDEFMENTK